MSSPVSRVWDQLLQPVWVPARPRPATSPRCVHCRRAAETAIRSVRESQTPQYCATGESRADKSWLFCINLVRVSISLTMCGCSLHVWLISHQGASRRFSAPENRLGVPNSQRAEQVYGASTSSLPTMVDDQTRATVFAAAITQLRTITMHIPS